MCGCAWVTTEISQFCSPPPQFGASFEGFPTMGRCQRGSLSLLAPGQLPQDQDTFPWYITGALHLWDVPSPSAPRRSCAHHSLSSPPSAPPAELISPIKHNQPVMERRREAARRDFYWEVISSLIESLPLRVARRRETKRRTGGKGV